MREDKVYANAVDLDEAAHDELPHHELPHLDLSCLQIQQFLVWYFKYL